MNIPTRCWVSPVPHAHPSKAYPAARTFPRCCVSKKRSLSRAANAFPMMTSPHSLPSADRQPPADGQINYTRTAKEQQRRAANTPLSLNQRTIDGEASSQRRSHSAPKTCQNPPHCNANASSGPSRARGQARHPPPSLSRHSREGLHPPAATQNAPDSHRHLQTCRPRFGSLCCTLARS